MRYYDQHLHTYFSPDSSETFENYLLQSDLPVVTTEHLDFISSFWTTDLRNHTLINLCCFMLSSW